MRMTLFPTGRRSGAAAALAALAISVAAPLCAAAPAGASAAARTKAAAPGKRASAKDKVATGSGRGAAAASKKTGHAKSVVVAPSEPEPVRSADAERLIAWVAAAHDNGKLPYIVIDKQAASLSLFGANGDFLGAVPVLLGVGVGDDSSPGVGAKELADIGPAERTTPAGRFIAKFGRAFGRQRVLWVDYANSVALHPVITTHKAERRVERLESPEIDDNRITFGCINVAVDFYARRVRPLFQKKGGLVYILPDTRTLDDVFPRVRLLPYLNGVANRQDAARLGG